METIDPIVASPLQPPKGNGSRGLTGPSKRSSPDSSLISRYRKLWKHTLALALIIGAGAFVWALRAPEPASSSVVLLIAGGPAEPTMEKTPYSPPSANITRIFHAVTSTEVTDHLVERLDLYAHYGIPADYPQKRVLATIALLSAVQPVYMDDQSIRITVQDRDPEMAAALANALFDKVSEMARRDATKQLERLLEMQQRLLARTDERSKERIEHLGAAVGEQLMARTATVNGAGSERTVMNADLRLALEELVSNATSVESIHRTLDFTSELLGSPGLPMITLSREAMAEPILSPMPRALNYGLLTVLLTFALGLFAITLWHKHGQEVRSFFMER